MANLAITTTFTANTLAKAAEVNTNFNDIVVYVNARNAGTTDWDVVKSLGAISSHALTNQLILGLTTTTTISATAPAANRVYTLPDVLGAANFILSEGIQTINGAKTFGASITAPAETLTNTTNQIVLGTTNTTTLSATAPAASRTYTLPDVLTNANFILSEGAQTLNGVKTLSAQSVHSAGLQTGSTIVSDTDNTDDLGTSAISFKDVYMKGDVKVGSTTAIDLASSGAVSIRGTATNDSASAGFVGEVIFSTVTTAANFPTTAQFGDLTSILLSAGDWLVSMYIENLQNGATVTDSIVGIGTAAGNSSTGLVNGDTSVQSGVITDAEHASIPSRRYSVAGATTLYLKHYATYSVATPQSLGRLSAVRIR